LQITREDKKMDVKKAFNFRQAILMLVLILAGALGRYLLVSFNLQPFPNFEIVTVIVFLAAMFISPVFAILVPLTSMILSDVLIGNPIFVGNAMNQIVLFTYSGFSLIALLNIWHRDKIMKKVSHVGFKSAGIVIGLGAGFVLLYDIWTNLGWWYLLYPHNLESLATVFALGIPFMIYHLISGVLTFAIIGVPILFYISHKMEWPILRPTKFVHKVPAIAIAICLIVLSFSGTALQMPEKSEIWLEKSDASSVRIIIYGSDWTIDHNIVAKPGSTVYSILIDCAGRYGFNVESTFWEEYNATVINSINGEKGNWMYYINGELDWTSCDKKIVSNGDVIEWKLV
jgi:hypothetical protein